MPVTLHGQGWPLEPAEITALWEAVRKLRHSADADIGIMLVSETEIARLNQKYHHEDKATNVLTFSYSPGEHDIAVCVSVIQREARERGSDARSYAALVVAHALLHITGLDHEASRADAAVMGKAEEAVLANCGFTREHL